MTNEELRHVLEQIESRISAIDEEIALSNEIGSESVEVLKDERAEAQTKAEKIRHKISMVGQLGDISLTFTTILDQYA